MTIALILYDKSVEITLQKLGFRRVISTLFLSYWFTEDYKGKGGCLTIGQNNHWYMTLGTTA